MAGNYDLVTVSNAKDNEALDDAVAAWLPHQPFLVLPTQIVFDVSAKQRQYDLYTQATA